VEDEQLGAVWAEFKDLRTGESRERLILHYAPLVHEIASRVGSQRPGSTDPSDLISYGMFGLLDAIDTWVPGRPEEFPAYAATRVENSIRAELEAGSQ
jgi:RNA polymerase sigma factor for flagellar operon FliA